MEARRREARSGPNSEDASNASCVAIVRECRKDDFDFHRYDVDPGDGCVVSGNWRCGYGEDAVHESEFAGGGAGAGLVCEVYASGVEQQYEVIVG